jgi:hypothetical protein
VRDGERIGGGAGPHHQDSDLALEDSAMRAATARPRVVAVVEGEALVARPIAARISGAMSAVLPLAKSFYSSRVGIQMRGNARTPQSLHSGRPIPVFDRQVLARLHAFVQYADDLDQTRPDGAIV